MRKVHPVDPLGGQAWVVRGAVPAGKAQRTVDEEWGYVNGETGDGRGKTSAERRIGARADEELRTEVKEAYCEVAEARDEDPPWLLLE